MAEESAQGPAPEHRQGEAVGEVGVEAAESPRSAPQTQGTTIQGPVQVDDAVDDADDPGYAGSEGSASYLTSLGSSVLHYKTAAVTMHFEKAHTSWTGWTWDITYIACCSEENSILPQSKKVLTEFSTWAPAPVSGQWTLQKWTHRKPFDYIHARELGGCISNDEKLFRQAFEHLAQGGYFELQATRPGRFLSDDGTAELATDAQFWMTTICEGAGRFGKPLDNAHEWVEKLRSVGFVDVQEEIRKVPIGSWPKDPTLKEIGKVQAFQESQLIESYTPGIFSRVLGWGETEIQVLISKVKRDLKNPAFHLYLPVYFVWGRKP
ncbi:putative umta methyltransferase family protein [Phaeoacremonium minimum UCRPA7]|uniref:Putative umta methyltransferase family protein n=1 Tax=Phaeoacremonium minimum (strain UCR-PA7) TaxID=1286976 RepID=R8B8L1_PHAM7|nr:putative umta methyltransferase family protein [Phaeoacremonium minimum UCRPA7]EON95636.1 putative umta methyltransferase family protein [Phaeoacremonium minimum UCRPA7]